MYKDLSQWTYEPEIDTHKPLFSVGGGNGGLEESLEDSNVTVHERRQRGEKEADALDDEETPFHWPEEANQYKVLASSAELTPTAIQNQSPIQADSSPRGTYNHALQIVTAQPRATVMGQHQVSTLRILVRLMRDVHSDVFDDETNLGENDSWTNVWFRLDATWGMHSEVVLKKRFGWVLQYIRDGALPNEAQCVKGALREV